MANSNELVVVFKGDSDHLKGEINSTRGLLGGLGDIAGGALKVGLLGAAAGGIALAGGLAASVKAAMDAEAGQAALGAVLASTGGKAGVTKEMANDLASSLQDVTRFEDDTILATENLLLTFTNISKDVFPQTTEMALNLAQAMGGDTKGAAIQLGKALNDPTKGMSALARVGVTFTDAQKEQIKTLQENGDLLGAQKVILAELETEFGGAARAAGDTFAGKLDILNHKFGDIMEQIGGALIPVLSLGADALIGLLKSDMVQQFAALIQSAIGGAVELFKNLTTVIGGSFSPLAKVHQIFYTILALFGVGSGQATYMANQWTQSFGQIQVVMAALWAFIAPILQSIFTELGKFGAEVLPKLQAAWDNILLVTQTVWNAILTFIQDNATTIMAFLEGVWLAIQGVIEVAWALIEGIIKIALDLIAGDFKAAGQDFTTMMTSIWEGIKKIIEGAWNAILAIVKLALDTLGKWILEKLTEVKNWFVEKFNEIMDFMGSLPGRFASLGAQMIQSLIDGLYADSVGVIEALQDIIQAAIDAAWAALTGGGGNNPPPPPDGGGGGGGGSSNIESGGGFGGGSGGRGGNSGTVNVYANVRNSQDIDALADAISQRLGTRAQHRISRGI